MGVLRVAARHADVVALSHRFDGGARHLTGPSVTSSTWSATRAKVDVVRAAAGDRFPDIELGVLVQQVTVTDDVAGAAASVAKTVGASPEDVLGSPCYLVGEVPAIVERLQMQREAVGISYVTVVAGDADRFAPVVRELSGR
jgi:hypothetical protein